MTKITELPAGGTADGSELGIWEQHSTTVTMTETTISALASDNSFNDSADGFVVAGFAEGDTVVVSGFTESANNLTTGVITALTAGKMTIGGTDGDGITDEVAGDSVTISKWVTVRLTAQEVADFASGGSALIGVYDLSANTLDSGNEIDIDVSAYSAVEFTLHGGSAGSNDTLGVRVSDDSGSTFYSTSGNYTFWGYSNANENVATATTRLIGSGFGTVGIMGNFRISNLNISGASVHCFGMTGANGDTVKTYNTVAVATTSAVDYLRFYAAGGNAFTGGTLVVRGIP